MNNTEIFNESNTLEATELAGKCYTEYSKYVTRTRAYASVIDGMKVVYRRILYAARNTNNMTKSASVVGDAIKYHPHSSEAIYGALVEMTCQFGYFPLFNAHGNFGGQGNSAAAMRYTECCISDIAKLMYLELIDYAEYIDGEAGHKEPKYLPSLLPYCLLVGTTSIPVGMPVPNIPSYDAKDLVQYYIDTLEGNTTKLPRPDYGEVIINDTEEETNKVIKTGQGKLWFKPIIIQEDENKFVLTCSTPNYPFWKLVSKLHKYIDDEVIDYIDETDENGERHVFIVNDESKLSPTELKIKIDKILKHSMKCSFILEEDGIAVYCGIDYIVNKGLKYLKECTVRKYQDYLSKSEFKYEVLKAINDYKNSKYFKKIVKSSYKEVVEVIKSLGYSEEVAKSVLQKPTSYLTKSHDDELSQISEDIKLYNEYINNPTKYLLTLYYRLKDMINDRYNKRGHSIYIEEYESSGKKYLHYDRNSNKLIINDDSNNGIQWNKVIYLVSSNGYLCSKYLSQYTSCEINLNDEEYEVSDVCNDKFRYLAITYDNKLTVIDTKSTSISGWTKVSKIDDDKPSITRIYNVEDDVVITDSRNSYESKITRGIKSRLSKPISYGRYNIISIKNKEQ